MTAPNSSPLPELRVIALAQLRAVLEGHSPRLLPTQGKGRAAVALVLRGEGGGLSLLFIERAEHPGDPWSGHLAFPGGRVEAQDADPRGAAPVSGHRPAGPGSAGAVGNHLPLRVPPPGPAGPPAGSHPPCFPRCSRLTRIIHP